MRLLLSRQDTTSRLVGPGAGAKGGKGVRFGKAGRTTGAGGGTDAESATGGPAADAADGADGDDDEFKGWAALTSLVVPAAGLALGII